MKAQVVSFRCVLRDKIGTIISSTFNRDVMTYVNSQKEPLQGLAEGLQNLKKGERRKIYIPADQAYGFYDPDLLLEVPRKSLSQSEHLSLGQQVLKPSEDPQGFKTFRVVQINSKSVTLDGNHPLAGQDLTFDIEAVEARDATLAEIAESKNVPSGEYLH